MCAGRWQPQPQDCGPVLSESERIQVDQPTTKSPSLPAFNFLFSLSLQVVRREKRKSRCLPMLVTDVSTDASLPCLQPARRDSSWSITLCASNHFGLSKRLTFLHHSLCQVSFHDSTMRRFRVGWRSESGAQGRRARPPRTRQTTDKRMLAAQCTKDCDAAQRHITHDYNDARDQRTDQTHKHG